MADAKAPQKLLGKLADAGEEAISKVSDLAGVHRLSTAVSTMRERLDEMQKRMRGLDDIEERLAKLEKRVDALAKPKRPRSSSSKATTKRSSSSAT